ncbi:S8 family serine peptidase [Micromonospora sp. LOL_025]|uniref:S8 family peptidase n=1 Tax=Micromonospora sp. LOL_025 TaxID=3345413 RepID=UPI003A8A56CA
MSSLIPRRSRRGGVACGLAVAVAVATVGVPAPVTAAPTVGEPGPNPTATATVTTATGDGLEATVTLITGHRVRYAEGADGRSSATVISSPDGPAATDAFRSYSDPTGVYVIPQSAQDLVARGLLDQELFDVRYLARNGYGDDAAQSMPVIVSYGTGTRARAASPAALPGATVRRDLPSVAGAGLSVDKARVGDFWTALTGGADRAAAARGPAARSTGPSLASGVGKVWLDQKVKVDLAESVPLIGAPQAWAAGLDGSGVKVAVLDTGIDADHPDVRGKVVGSKSFVPGVESVTDGHGHGTHVAATIAGSGAGSGGARKGVAPGADLLVAKVLNDGGNGDMSWIIDAMEWAATSGAKVVSMSLGGEPTDGTDPASQAVNRLTAETGTLFVIAAGNSGRENTVGAPGAADAALTVGATSKTDQLADFSSRGPRVGDRAIKPDISAPGVGIVAARAAGTSMGTPVDDRYTSANGTSMATPHVAGAAAVLAQQHPDWTAAQLKPTLIGTSKDAGHTAYEQGAGRLDLARAVRQQVTTGTVNVDFGTVSPNTDPRLDRQVSYHNPTAQPVTLTLTPTLRRISGGDATGALNTPASVTVPAGGTGEVTVSLDAAELEIGSYTGSLVATDEATGTRLTLAVGLIRQPPMRTITTRIVGVPGDPIAMGNAPCDFRNLRDDTSYLVMMGGVPGQNVIQGVGYVPDGEYHVSCWGAYWGDTEAFRHQAWLENPQYTISGNATLEYDLARDLVEVEKIDTPLPSEAVHLAMGSTFSTASGLTYSNMWYTGPGHAYSWRTHVVPSRAKPTIGKYGTWFEQLRAAPEAITTVHGNGRLRVNPTYLTDSEFAPKFATDQRLQLASRADLLAGRDVKGKLILLDSPANSWFVDEIEQAAKAGAAGVLQYFVGRDDIGLPAQIPPYDIVKPRLPLLWLDGAQGAKVAKVIAGAKRPYVDIDAQLVSPYQYKLRHHTADRMPAKPVDSVRHRDLVQVRSEQHAQVPSPQYQTNAHEVSHTYVPGQTFSANAAHDYDVPVARTEYYNVTGPDVLWARYFTVINRADGASRGTDHIGTFTRPLSRTEKIHQPPVVLGTLPSHPPQQHTCMSCRDGDTIYLLERSSSAADLTSSVSGTRRVQATLERDGARITPNPPPGRGGNFLHWTVSPEPGEYTLRTVREDRFSGQTLAKRIATDWTFRSAGATGTVREPAQCYTALINIGTGACDWQPLIQLEHDFDLSLTDTAQAGRAYRFEVTPHAAPNAPRIAGLRTWVSYDDGATWKQAVVVPGLGGSYHALVVHPKLAKTTGAVSVRTEAWDRSGNRVVQTIDRAYGLTDVR